MKIATTTLPLTVFFGSLLAVSAALAACKDRSPESATHAEAHAAMLGALADHGIADVEKGLPEAADKLAARFAAPDDPRGDVNALHDALVHARATTPSLAGGPASFCALVDPAGVVMRNDLVTDEMAGTRYFAAYPALQKVAPGGVVETVGPPFDPGALDEEWLAAVSVGPNAAATLVVGFSYRVFATRLSDALRDELEAESRDAGRPDDIPIAYVAIFDAHGVWAAAHTPGADLDALRSLDLVAKTANGPFKGTTRIATRGFGVAAVRTPKVGAETGVVVLRSEI